MVQRVNLMNDSNLDEEYYDSVKTHQEILILFDELKEFENRYKFFEVEEPIVEEELIEVDTEDVHFIEVDKNVLEFTDINLETDQQEESLSLEEELPKKSRFKKLIKRKKSAEEKPKKAATFKVRFDEDGNLVYLDIKKTKPKEKSGKKFSLGKLKGRRKSKGETEGSETKGKSLKKSKIKGRLGKLGKLKKAIPSKSKKKEESETEE